MWIFHFLSLKPQSFRDIPAVAADYFNQQRLDCDTVGQPTIAQLRSIHDMMLWATSKIDRWCNAQFEKKFLLSDEKLENVLTKWR